MSVLATPQARQALRLRLKPAGSTNGYVDGAWWPRSRDLAAELPALAQALTARLGSVWQVVFALTSWDSVPRRVQFDGHPVRLEGFHSQDENVVSVVSLDRQRIRLLVIPTNVSEAVSQDAMKIATTHDNADSPAAILKAASDAHPA
jgi:hypothetical protein